MSKTIQGQLGDPNAEAFYESLIASREARDAWNDILVPKSDTKKLAHAKKCLALVRNFNANRRPIAA